ncbi:hypothetical protein [Allobaculum sp. JKK-2023]|uniref:hypothetical protein n=1 Tax=Allobaculum sp. JKK-2023 TaxID=3108943 RepID=UPI002B051EC2|nr:hypothetical protein [Allobaculum sp. JKK-2023]
MNTSLSKPEIICYMMTSVDGRIDCAMTAKLPGVEEYYLLLDAFQFDATVSGRQTAQLEMAQPGQFQAGLSGGRTGNDFQQSPRPQAL